MRLLQNDILTALVWGSTAHNLPCLCPNFPCPGFVGLQEPDCSGQAVEMSQLWVHPWLWCRRPEEPIQAELGMRWPHSPHAEMGLCAWLNISWAPQELNGTRAAGLTFLTNRLSVFHVCSGSEVSQLHQFPCVRIIWAEILDRNMGILPLIPAARGEEEMSMTLH